MAQIIDFNEYRKHRKLRRRIRIVRRKPIRKRKKMRAKKAARQGHLDNLCGVYSIINAVNAVHKFKEADRERLFRRLVLTLEKEAIVDGTCKKHMDTMLREAVVYVQKRHGVSIAIHRLFKRSHVDIGLKAYWRTLRRFLGASKRRAIIIGTCGRHDHWTCVKAMSRLSMKLLDSSGSKRLRRRFCRMGKPYTHKHYHLIPSQVWGISLKKD